MLYANFLIGLREGLEATMIVTILAAYLKKTGRTKELPWLWAGVATALIVTLAAFAGIHFGTKTLSTIGQELIGGIASLITVAMITWMLLWMSKAGHNIAAELKGKMDSAIGPRAVWFVAFIAVAREGIETILLVFDSITSDNSTPILGLAAGLAIAVVLGVAMYKGAIKINLAVFFKVVGILLVIVAAGILRYGIGDLQEAGVLPGVHTYAFDISAVLTPGTWYASLLEGMFNIVPQPTLLSFIGWAVYLVVAMVLFLKPPSTKATASTTKASEAKATEAQAPAASADTTSEHTAR
ncbi:iron transporter [Corynebacterium sp. zg254]|uniref:iron uptake transporter permease EfeU n=1 Tax=Corynebacterium sp. zg254 TaxID=2656645 RepID=UPI002150D71F|nr:iron uptake transporter permease EfeU [Corynebacterium sp. zg254]MCR5913621.1 iron transporter [Corynebacterium sp. zg254]